MSNVTEIETNQVELNAALDRTIDMVSGVSNIMTLAPEDGSVLLRASMEAIYPGSPIDVVPSMEGLGEFFKKIITAIVNLFKAIYKNFKRFIRWLVGTERKVTKKEEDLRDQHRKRENSQPVSGDVLKLKLPLYIAKGSIVTVDSLISHNSLTINLLEAVELIGKDTINYVQTVPSDMGKNNTRIKHVWDLAKETEKLLSDILYNNLMANDKLNQYPAVEKGKDGVSVLVHRSISNQGVYLYGHVYHGLTTYQWITVSGLSKEDQLSRVDTITLEEGSSTLDDEALTMHSELIRMAVSVSGDTAERYSEGVTIITDALKVVSKTLEEAGTNAMGSRRQAIESLARIAKVLNNGITASIKVGKMAADDTTRSLSAIEAIVDAYTPIQTA